MRSPGRHYCRFCVEDPSWWKRNIDRPAPACEPKDVGSQRSLTAAGRGGRDRVEAAVVRGYGCCIDLVEAARGEVASLHEFFVGWFTGSLEDADQVFGRFVDALHPEFSMISPSGVTLDRDAVVAWVRAAHGTADASFTIEIRNMVEVLISSDAVVVGYEEWQLVGGGATSRRVSSAVFVRSLGAGDRVRWRHLHETFRLSDTPESG